MTDRKPDRFYGTDQGTDREHFERPGPVTPEFGNPGSPKPAPAPSKKTRKSS